MDEGVDFWDNGDGTWSAFYELKLNDYFNIPNLILPDGYEVYGWYGTRPESANHYFNITEDKQFTDLYIGMQTFYVHFYYTLTYDPTGGDSSVVVTSKGTEYDKCRYGDQISSITCPTRTGYEFKGYYTQKNGQGECIIIGTGSPYNYYYNWLEPITAYAHWEASKYTIVLKDQDGTTDLGTVNNVQYQSMLQSIAPPTKTGYTFQGYFTSVSGGTKYYNADGTGARQWDQTSGGTLYAHWTKSAYSVTFDYSATNLLPDSSFETGAWAGGERSTSYVHSGGYSYKVTATTSAPEFLVSTTGTISLNKDHIYYACVYAYQPTKIGSIDCYWPIAEPNMGEYSAKEAGMWNLYSWKVSRSSFTSGNHKLRFDFNNSGVAGTTYFDSAKLIDLTATFGAGKEPDKTWCDQYLSTTATYNSVMPSITPPTMTGYTFLGYYDTSATTGGTQYYTAAGTSAKNWDKAANTTLYARWSENNYTIKFDPNGGSGTMSNQTLKFTESYTLPNSAFTRPGYIFAGWSSLSTTSSTSSSVVKVGATVKELVTTNGGSFTYYAIWEDTWANYFEQPQCLDNTKDNSEDNPYLIATPQNLAWMARQTEEGNDLSGLYFKQAENIDLSSYVWKPIGINYYQSFAGNYDGNNFVISNLYTTQIKNASGSYLYNYQGLFGYTDGATIKNVNIFSLKVYGNQYVGGIVGASNSSTVENCQVYGNIKGSTNVGGIMGYSEQETIKNCYSEATITADGASGGILGGMHYKATIENCAYINTSSWTTGTMGSAIAGGTTSSANITNCYSESNANNFAGGKISNCLFVQSGVKKRSSTWTLNDDGDYGWVILNGKTMPNGLTWVGNVGEKVKDVQDLIDLGFSQTF